MQEQKLHSTKDVADMTINRKYNSELVRLYSFSLNDLIDLEFLPPTFYPSTLARLGYYHDFETVHQLKCYRCSGIVSAILLWQKEGGTYQPIYYSIPDFHAYLHQCHAPDCPMRTADTSVRRLSESILDDGVENIACRAVDEPDGGPVDRSCKVPNFERRSPNRTSESVYFRTGIDQNTLSWATAGQQSQDYRQEAPEFVESQTVADYSRPARRVFPSGSRNEGETVVDARIPQGARAMTPPPRGRESGMTVEELLNLLRSVEYRARIRGALDKLQVGPSQSEQQQPVGSSVGNSLNQSGEGSRINVGQVLDQPRPVNSQPRHPHLVSQRSRLDTFKRPGIVLPLGQDINLLAEAGFFHTGPHDNVRCYCCDGGLKNWKMSDEPWTEHCRCFPTCSHVTHNKSSEFIQHAQTINTSQQNSQPRPPSGLSSTKQVPSSMPVNQSGQNNSDERFAVDKRQVNARLDGDHARHLINTGYSIATLREVIRRQLATVGDDFPSVASMLAAVNAFDDERRAQGLIFEVPNSFTASKKSQNVVDGRLPLESAESECSTSPSDMRSAAGGGVSEQTSSASVPQSVTTSLRASTAPVTTQGLSSPSALVAPAGGLRD